MFEKEVNEMRIAYMIKKEIVCSKENISFHLVSVISSLLFVFAFTLMLSEGITFPLKVYSPNSGIDFQKQLENYKSPFGENYFEVNGINNEKEIRNANDNILEIARELKTERSKVSGKLFFFINDANANMTKNYRNRLHGAVLEYINKSQNYKISAEEIPRYQKDIPWDSAFGVSVFAFGIALSGLLFGMLSMTYEWEDRTNIFIKLSPKSKSNIIVAKCIVSIIKSFLSSGIFAIIYYLIYKCIPNKVGILLLTVVISSIIFIFIGMLIGHYVRSTITSFLMSMILALTLWIGGGGFGSLLYFGDITQYLGKINPVTYILELLRWIYFKGNVELMNYILILCSFAAVSFLLLSILFNKWCRKEILF